MDPSYLATFSDSDLASRDVALSNLECALGLPGSEDINIPAYVNTLDEWAGIVQGAIDHYRPKFEAAPEEYEDSVAHFRILVMVSVVQQLVGVSYNPKRIHNPDFKDSRDLFIHGLIEGHGGTCLSLPVLYVAIGRRLGYPLRLVTTKAHVFVRWDEPGERFNIEATNPKGFTSEPDDHFRHWPLPWDAEDRAAGVFLKSLSPKEELGTFFAARGHCFEDNFRFSDAVYAYQWASELHPRCPWYRKFLAGAAEKLRAVGSLAGVQTE